MKLIKKSCLLVILILLFCNVSVYGSQSYKSLLFKSVENNNLSGVKKAVNNGVEINTKDDSNWTALMQAANSGYLEIVNYLLAQGADVNA